MLNFLQTINPNEQNWNNNVIFLVAVLPFLVGSFSVICGRYFLSKPVRSYDVELLQKAISIFLANLCTLSLCISLSTVSIVYSLADTVMTRKKNLLLIDQNGRIKSDVVLS